MVYAQLLAFPVLVIAGIWLGRRAARTPRWWALVAGAMAVIAVVVAARRMPRVAAGAPASWVVDGDINPFLMTPVIAALFAVLLSRLPAKRSRVAPTAAMGVMLVYFGLLPAAEAVVVGPMVARGRTHLDQNRICLQSHSFTCTPCATVTCLAQLGFPAEEAGLALAARATPSYGTDARILVRVLRQEYPALQSDYGYFESLDALPLPAVAECTFARIGGHSVAVLGVTPEMVVIGDPLSGRTSMPRAEFLRQWQHTAIVFHRGAN